MRPRKNVFLECDPDLFGELRHFLETRAKVLIWSKDVAPDARVFIKPGPAFIGRVADPPLLVHDGSDRADLIEKLKFLLTKKRGPKPKVRV